MNFPGDFDRRPPNSYEVICTNWQKGQYGHIVTPPEWSALLNPFFLAKFLFAWYDSDLDLISRRGCCNTFSSPLVKYRPFVVCRLQPSRRIPLVYPWYPAPLLSVVNWTVLSGSELGAMLNIKYVWQGWLVEMSEVMSSEMIVSHQNKHLLRSTSAPTH